MSLTAHYISLIFVNTMWGISFIASKYALNVGFTPMTLALWRYILTAAVLVPALLIKEKRMRLERRDIWPMFLSGLLGITLYYFFEYKGIQITSAVSASLILAAVPILTLLTDTLVMKAKLKPRQAVGSLLSLAGGRHAEAGVRGDARGAVPEVRTLADLRALPALRRAAAVGRIRRHRLAAHLDDGARPRGLG